MDAMRIGRGSNKRKRRHSPAYTWRQMGRLCFMPLSETPTKELAMFWQLNITLIRSAIGTTFKPRAVVMLFDPPNMIVQK